MSLSQLLRVSFSFPNNPFSRRLAFTQFAYIVLLFLSSCDNFILIGHSKQCLRSQKNRGALRRWAGADELEYATAQYSCPGIFMVDLFLDRISLERHSCGNAMTNNKKLI